MQSNEKALWNEKYQREARSLEPDPFLVKAYARFLAGSPPADALDIAGGAGRHAVWLARRGWRVKLIDVSEAGIALAHESVRKNLDEPVEHAGGRVETESVDLNSVRDLGQNEYDLALVFFYLQRELFPAIAAALKPGGFLFYKTYTTEQRRLGGGPNNPDYLLQPNELREAFSEMRILYYNESVTSIAAAELVAQKLA